MNKFICRVSYCNYPEGQCLEGCDQIYPLMRMLEPPTEQEPVEIEMPEYHSHGMGCGLEDRGITDRYEAMEYGWYEAIDRVKEELANFGPLYTAPQPVKQPLTREELFELAEPFGEFQYGDAQGHKRIDFANAIIAAYERINVYAAPQPRRRLTDEEIDNTTRKQVDDLLDHIYEYGTAAEGIDYRVRAIARAIEAAVWGGGK